MTTQLLTQEQATGILNRTTASMAIKALHFDVVQHYGPVTHKFVKATITPDLQAVSDLLASSVFSDNQFKSASYALHHDMGLIDRRGGQDGHIAVATLCQADAVFASKRGFGANTIAEFRTAVELMADVCRGADDQERPVDPPPVVYEEVSSEEGSFPTKGDDVQGIKAQIIKCLQAVDAIFKQMQEVFDRPLPSQVDDDDRWKDNPDQTMDVLVKQDDGSMDAVKIEAPIQPKHVPYMQNRS